MRKSRRKEMRGKCKEKLGRELYEEDTYGGYRLKAIGDYKGCNILSMHYNRQA